MRATATRAWPRCLLAGLAGWLVLGELVVAGADAEPAAADRVSVSLDPSQLSTTVGERTRIASTVRNDGDRALTGLVAHLDVLSVSPGVYVDPEDWSATRTVYLEPLPAHGSIRLPWTVKVVNDGRFVIYVTVTRQQGAATVDSSDGLRLSASASRTVDAGSVLPLVLGVPGCVLALLLISSGRRRRRS